MAARSCSKGKVGEREVANLLCAHGFEARRAQQFKGGQHSEDVWCPALRAKGLHIEVKRTEQMRLLEWLTKAREECAGSGAAPLICWRKNGEDWLAILPLAKLLDLLKPGDADAGGG